MTSAEIIALADRYLFPTYARAPLALVRYGDYLRQRKPADAVPVLLQVKQQYEQALLNDPARKEWVPVLNYAYAMALKESGKPTEARAEFEALARRFPGTTHAAEAVWRAAQRGVRRLR
jgi:hypothetical protein